MKRSFPAPNQKPAEIVVEGLGRCLVRPPSLNDLVRAEEAARQAKEEAAAAFASVLVAATLLEPSLDIEQASRLSDEQVELVLTTASPTGILSRRIETQDPALPYRERLWSAYRAWTKEMTEQIIRPSIEAFHASQPTLIAVSKHLRSVGPILDQVNQTAGLLNTLANIKLPILAEIRIPDFTESYRPILEMLRSQSFMPVQEAARSIAQTMESANAVYQRIAQLPLTAPGLPYAALAASGGLDLATRLGQLGPDLPAPAPDEAEERYLAILSELRKVHPAVADKLEGARRANIRREPDWISQMANSLVEAVVWTLELEAPAQDLQDWCGGFHRSGLNREGQPSRAAAVRFLCIKRAVDYDLITSLEHELNHVVRMLQAQKHRLEHETPETMPQLMDLLLGWFGAIYLTY